jgi:NADH:ubiquinone oxidoreductase subunit 6 (subunit J)
MRFTALHYVVLALLAIGVIMGVGVGLTRGEMLVRLNAVTVIFYLLGGLAAACAMAVAFSKNILHSAFALMGTLAGVAGLYFMLGADFIGVVQLLVYVGGILVLILFAVLLTRDITDIKISNLQVSLLGGVPAALLILGVLVRVLVGAPFQAGATAAAPTVGRIGDALLREYLLPFEVASVILLMALVGAMVIARRAVKEEAGANRQNPEVSQ